MATVARDTYSLEVVVSGQMQEILVNAEYRLMVGDAVGSDEPGSFRPPASTNVVHPEKQPKVHANCAITATFELDAIPVPQYWIGYIEDLETRKILGKRPINYGQVYTLSASGIEVKTPKATPSWIPERGFGFENFKTVAPVLLRGPAIQRRCGPNTHKFAPPPNSAAITPHQPLWVPGVGKLIPRIPLPSVKRKVAIWFQNEYETAMMTTADQSRKWEIEWEDRGDIASPELTLHFLDNGIFSHDDKATATGFSQGGFQETVMQRESENEGFQEEEIPAGGVPLGENEIQNEGFQPHDEAQDDDFQNHGFEPQDEVDDGDYENEGFHEEVQHDDFQNGGFQPCEDEVPQLTSTQPKSNLRASSKKVNGNATVLSKSVPQTKTGAKLKVTLMNGQA